MAPTQVNTLKTIGASWIKMTNPVTLRRAYTPMPKAWETPVAIP